MCGCTSPDVAEANECGCDAPVCSIERPDTLATAYERAKAEVERLKGYWDTVSAELARLREEVEKYKAFYKEFTDWEDADPDGDGAWGMCVQHLLEKRDELNLDNDRDTPPETFHTRTPPEGGNDMPDIGSQST